MGRVMKGAALTQFLIDITRGHCMDAFVADADAVLGASVLPESLRHAIRMQDVGTLWLAGAHPMALLYFARASGWSNERYYGCLADAELRRDAAAERAPSPVPGPPRTHQ